MLEVCQADKRDRTGAVGRGARSGLAFGVSQGTKGVWERDLETEGGGVRGGNVQESQAEDAHEEVLLLLPELQLVQHRQGHDEYGEVGGDVSSGVDVPKGQVGYALPRHVRVPEFIHRRAGEYHDEELRHCPHHDDGPQDPYDLLHLVYCQHSIVLEKERELDEGEGDIVKDNGQPEILSTR